MLKCILQTSSLLRHIAFATIKRVPPSGENKPTTVGHYILRLFFIGELHNHLLQESSHNVLSVQEKGGGGGHRSLAQVYAVRQQQKYSQQLLRYLSVWLWLYNKNSIHFYVITI